MWKCISPLNLNVFTALVWVLKVWHFRDYKMTFYNCSETELYRTGVYTCNWLKLQASLDLEPEMNKIGFA